MQIKGTYVEELEFKVQQLENEKAELIERVSAAIEAMKSEIKYLTNAIEE